MSCAENRRARIPHRLFCLGWNEAKGGKHGTSAAEYGRSFRLSGPRGDLSGDACGKAARAGDIDEVRSEDQRIGRSQAGRIVAAREYLLLIFPLACGHASVLA